LSPYAKINRHFNLTPGAVCTRITSERVKLLLRLYYTPYVEYHLYVLYRVNITVTAFIFAWHEY